MATLPVDRGANGQPPRPPIDASRTVTPSSSAASAFGSRRAPGVVEMDAVGNFVRLTSARTRPAASQRRSCPRVRSRRPCAPAPREVGDPAGVDFHPSNGQPNATRDRHRRADRVLARAVEDRALHASTDSVDLAPVRVPVVEGLGRGEREVRPLPERRAGEPIVALLVQRTSPANVVPWCAWSPVDDVLGAVHLRYPVAADETRPPPRAGDRRRRDGCKRLGPHLRVEPPPARSEARRAGRRCKWSRSA